MPKAVMKASLIWYIKAKGLLLRTTRKISGRMINAWIIKPTITVTMNNASLPSSSPISSMLATRCAIRLQIPTGAYLQTTTEKRNIRIVQWSSTHMTRYAINYMVAPEYVLTRNFVHCPMSRSSIVALQQVNQSIAIIKRVLIKETVS